MDERDDIETPADRPRRFEGIKAIADFLSISERWAGYFASDDCPAHLRLPVYTLNEGPRARLFADEPDLIAWVESRKQKTRRDR